LWRISSRAWIANIQGPWEGPSTGRRAQWAISFSIKLVLRPWVQPFPWMPLSAEEHQRGSASLGVALSSNCQPLNCLELRSSDLALDKNIFFQ